MKTKFNNVIMWVSVAAFLCGWLSHVAKAAVTITDAKFSDEMTYGANGSDRWALTWTDKDEIFTTFSDGRGFAPQISTKLSMGIAKVTGPATAWKGINLRSSTIEKVGEGETGEKASGMVMVNGTIYMMVGNINHAGEQTKLAWSSDYGKTWKWSSWTLKELGYVCFVNYGKNYEGAMDDYVYMLSPDTPSSRYETDSVVMARVAKNSVTDRNAYEFFSGTSSAPKWSKAIADRKPVFELKGGCNRLDVTYNAPLKLFIMNMRSRGYGGGIDQFTMYYSSKPWGPWTRFYQFKTDSSASLSVWPGESIHFPSKWISSDGLTMYMVGAYLDRFNVQKVTLTIKDSGGDTVPAAPSGLTASASSSTQINLSWNDNSDNETSFRILRRKGSSGSYTYIKSVSANDTTFTDSGLSADTVYYYKVRAMNSIGGSSYSNAASAKTTGAAAAVVVTMVVTDDQTSEFWHGRADWTVSRSGSTSSDLTVYYTVGGTATNGVDYRANTPSSLLTGSVVIPAGSASTMIKIWAYTDSISDPDETIDLNLASDAAYSIGGSSGGTVLIKE